MTRGVFGRLDQNVQTCEKKKDFIFLSSKMGEYVNGETILVDGGMIATGLGVGRPDDK